MSKPYDTKLIMIVAQQPFQSSYNDFCKLVPLLYTDGTPVDLADFPNDGEIWWMLTNQTMPLATPGRLAVGYVEDALRYERHEPSSSAIQAVRDSVQAPRTNDLVEVLTLPEGLVSRVGDLVLDDLRLETSHWPTPAVLLRWGTSLYGPYSTQVQVDNAKAGVFQVAVTPAEQDMSVMQWNSDLLRDHPTMSFVTEVSSESFHRHDSSQLRQVETELVLGDDLRQLVALGGTRIERIDRKLLRLVRPLITKRQRQELAMQLEELVERTRETEEVVAIAETVAQIGSLSRDLDDALDRVTEGMLEAGLVGEQRVARALEAFQEQYVHDHSAELQAQIESTLSAKRDELRQVESRLEEANARSKADEARRWQELEAELEAFRTDARREATSDREEIARQRTELERQQNLLQGNLQQVTSELRNAGDEVVNRFLTIAPLLRSWGLIDGRAEPTISAPTVGGAVGNQAPSPLELPAFLSGPCIADTPQMSEEEFFDRFARHVVDCGFSYDAVDLKAFHLSAKCGSMAILGGPSGTGKSSLPMLYASALLGEDSEQGRPGCLMVNVNPSWMEVRDLLGHFNTLEGRFYPAESGLFQRLVWAQEEFANRQASSGLYLVCLDEMNLSQVEHYFSDFMAVMEREGSARSLDVFSREAASSACPFSRWATISLSPALRFVGTVNFDETTRKLSDRLLDRANLMMLTGSTLPASSPHTSSVSIVLGRAVTLADFERWSGPPAMPAQLASLLDELRPVLQELGCPISPRVYRAVCRFVGAASPLLTPDAAFDIQLAQRVVPKIRNLVTRRQLDALDRLTKMLDQSSICSFKRTMGLLYELRAAAMEDPWMAGE